MYTIKRAAELVGISAATLRAWERRYQIVAPSRSEGGYRLYGEEDLRVLSSMARLVADGWTPSSAADEARRRAEPPSVVEPDSSVARQRFGSANALLEDLVAAARALDADRLGGVLDELFASGSYEAVVDRYLLPAMSALGEAWSSGRVSVAGEHLASHAVMRRLAAAYEAAAAYGERRRVVIGLPPGARHEIGVFAFAVAVRRRGLGVDYLGADLPVQDWAAAVADDAIQAVVVAVPTTADAASARAVVAALRATHPGPRVIAVGGGQQAAVPDAVPLGHDVAEAAAALSRLLQ